MSDILRVLAFAFRRKGAQRMPGGDLRLLLAYDLRWFAPEDAKRVVARALETGLLAEQAGELAPTFDLAAVEVPVNFRPTLAVLDEDVVAPARAAGPAPVPVPATGTAPTPAPAPALGPGNVDAIEAERRKHGLLLSAEVARLLVERRAGADVAQRAAELEAQLLRSA